MLISPKVVLLAKPPGLETWPRKEYRIQVQTFL